MASPLLLIIGQELLSSQWLLIFYLLQDLPQQSFPFARYSSDSSLG